MLIYQKHIILIDLNHTNQQNSPQEMVLQVKGICINF